MTDGSPGGITTSEPFSQDDISSILYWMKIQNKLNKNFNNLVKHVLGPINLKKRANQNF